jgi:hypothetical protein
MLTSHRDIMIPPECGFALWLYDKYIRKSEHEWRDKGLLLQYARDVLESRKIEFWDIDIGELSIFLQNNSPTDYASATSLVYALYALKHKGRITRWGDKNNYYLHHISRLKALFPGAVFIHIVRDGRDVACSYLELKKLRTQSPYAPKLPGTVEAIAQEWRDNLTEIRLSFDAFRWEGVHELRYEDLVTNTDGTLHAICGFLGEEWDPMMLEYHRLNREQHLEPQELLAWKSKTLQRVDNRQIGKFRKILTAEQIRIFEQMAGPALGLYGYGVGAVS